MLPASPVADTEEWGVTTMKGSAACASTNKPALKPSPSRPPSSWSMARWAALLEHCGNDIDEARGAMADRYLGNYASVADYVQEVTEKTTSIPESLRCYIDWKAMSPRCQDRWQPVHRRDRLWGRPRVRGALNLEQQPLTYRVTWQGTKI